MISAADLLEGLEGPAAVVDGAGVRLASNAAFDGLPAADQTAALAPGATAWRSRSLPSGARLILPDRRRVGAMRRADVMATLSHEIRTPLNGVLGMAGLMEGTRLDATQRAYLATLRDCGDHLLELVGSVLDWARLDAGKVSLEPGPADLERLLQGVAELLSPQAHAKGVEIAWAVEGDATAVVADDGRLRQILFNLAGNAVKLTEEGGVRLTARTTPLPSTSSGEQRVRLRLEVTDTGPGLTREQQVNIFEPFAQTDEGVRAGGAGLGLAIVRQLSDMLGGRVTLTSVPGQGAAFAFEMDALVVAAAAATPLAGRTVAVVSASEVVAHAAALQLQALGAQATRLPRLADLASMGEAVDLILFDPPATSRLPAPPKGPPTLVLVAPETRNRIPRIRALGYAGYLIKPLRRASLEARALAALAPMADLAHALPAIEDERLRPAVAPVGLRVLLAEDNPVNAMLATMLLKNAGCRVDRAGGGVEAVEMAAQAPYDLVLLDLRMPDMDGLTAARTLREQGIVAPIAALTANAFDEDRRACQDAGMDAFLTKPLERQALTDLLARFAPSAREAAA